MNDRPLRRVVAARPDARGYLHWNIDPPVLARLQRDVLDTGYVLSIAWNPWYLRADLDGDRTRLVERHALRLPLDGRLTRQGTVLPGRRQNAQRCRGVGVEHPLLVSDTMVGKRSLTNLSYAESPSDAATVAPEAALERLVDELERTLVANPPRARVILTQLVGADPGRFPPRWAYDIYTQITDVRDLVFPL